MQIYHDLFTKVADVPIFIYHDLCNPSLRLNWENRNAGLNEITIVNLPEPGYALPWTQVVFRMEFNIANLKIRWKLCNLIPSLH